MKRVEVGEMAVEVPTTPAEITATLRAAWRCRPALVQARSLTDQYWGGYSAGVKDITDALRGEREQTTAQATTRHLRSVPTHPEVSA